MPHWEGNSFHMSFHETIDLMMTYLSHFCWIQSSIQAKSFMFSPVASLSLRIASGTRKRFKYCLLNGWMLGISLWSLEFVCTQKKHGGARGKEPACQCRRYKRCKFNPWVRKMPRSWHSNPLQYSRLENCMHGGAWRAAVHRVIEVKHSRSRLALMSLGNNSQCIWPLWQLSSSGLTCCQ